MTVAVPNDTPSSLRVERSDAATLATRLAYPALLPMRWSLKTLVAMGKWSPLTLHWVFAATSCTDVYAAPLRPERRTRRESVAFEGPFRGEWLWRDSSDAVKDRRVGAVLYLHGGGFVACGLNTHRRLAARVGRAAGLPVLHLGYRQLPRAHLTESLEDCLTGYRYLLDQGFSGDRMVVVGDSAGGGLAFLLALACRERGLAPPAGIAALSPWGDLDNAARLAHPNAVAGRDAFIPAEGLGLVANWGFAIDGELEPAWQPAKLELAGLPPVLIQVGSTEVMRSDAERLALRCAAAQVPCTLQIWDRAPHVFQAGADLLPQGRDAIGDIGRFIRRVIATGTDRGLRTAS
jgi:acetyl esterase/lipase